MKGFRIIAALLILALLAGSAALAEDASTDLPAEALCQYGEEAVLAGDYEKAMAYFQQAAEQDDPEALWSLGTLYYYGYGVEQSYEEAQAYFRRAAELGHVRALNSIGYMYLNGEGVQQDYAKALEYVGSAAEQGDKQGQINLGYMYLNGLGVEQSYEKAAENYRKAAELGVEDAVDSLKALVEAGHVSEAYLDGLEQ